MTDYFEELGIPRRAALDAEAVRAAFQARGAALHPDHARGESDRAEKAGAFQDLQEAYAVLSSTPRRLRHLGELLGYVAPRAGIIDESLMPLFSKIHTLLQKVDALLAQKTQATSALSKALLTAPTLEMESSLAECAGELLERSRELHDRLRAWDEAAPVPDVLAGAGQEAAFLEKWELQIQQRRLRLMA